MKPQPDRSPQCPSASRYSRFMGFGPWRYSSLGQSVVMSHSPRPLPEELGDQFSAAQALEQGLTRRRLRGGDLESPYYRVRRRKDFARRAEEEAEADQKPYARARRERKGVVNNMKAYSKVMSAESFFCGRTAAVVYRLPIDHPGDLEVAVIAPRRAPRAKGIKGRRIAGHLVTTRLVDGLLLSSPASTWAMLAKDLSERELVEIGDAIVQIPRDRFGKQHPEQALATIAQLQAAAAAGPRPPATARLRSALEKVRVGSSSPLETDYRLIAAAAGLPEPELDQEIRRPNGQLLGISEFFYRDYGLVVEVEGDHHRSDPVQWDRDIDKYRAYKEVGLDVERLTSRHIRGDNPSCLDAVRAALRRRGWEG